MKIAIFLILLNMILLNNAMSLQDWINQNGMPKVFKCKEKNFIESYKISPEVRDKKNPDGIYIRISYDTKYAYYQDEIPSFIGKKNLEPIPAHFFMTTKALKKNNNPYKSRCEEKKDRFVDLHIADDYFRLYLVNNSKVSFYNQNLDDFNAIEGLNEPNHISYEDHLFLTKLLININGSQLQEQKENYNENNTGLDKNNLDKIGPFLQNLYKLHLYLNRNNIKSLPEDFGYLYNLERLDISDNNLESLPNSIGKLFNLKILSLNNNKLKLLPESLGNCKNLMLLDANYNKLSTLPDSMKFLKKMICIEMRNNSFMEIPQVLANEMAIPEMDFSNNHITSIPESITKNKVLRFLILDNNNITKLEDYIKKSNLLDKIWLKNQKPLSLWVNYIKKGSQPTNNYLQSHRYQANNNNWLPARTPKLTSFRNNLLCTRKENLNIS